MKEFKKGHINCDDFSQADFIQYQGNDLFEVADYFAEFVGDAAQKGYMVYGNPISSAPGPEFTLHDLYQNKERSFLNFCSYNYLGYSTHPEVIGAVQATVGKYGTGAVSAPLLSGYYDLSYQLEQSIAQFKGKTGAVIFPTGYGTNLGAISAILKPGDVAVLDILAHASIYDGVRLAGADVKVFAHNSAKHLDRVLSDLEGRRVLVCLEGIYSMDGDMADLPPLVEVCKKHGAKILLDEAHSSLLFGKKGRGVAEELGVEKDIDITVGTFSKAFGAIGGFVCGDAALMQYIRCNAHSYVFSCAMAPHTAAGILKVLELYQQDQSPRDRLMANAKYMLEKLQAAGFDTGETQSQVIPVIVGNDRKLREVSKRIFAAGLYTGIVTYPAVSSKRTRLRLSMSSTHTKEQMDRAVQILIDVFDSMKDFQG